MLKKLVPPRTRLQKTASDLLQTLWRQISSSGKYKYGILSESKTRLSKNCCRRRLNILRCLSTHGNISEYLDYSSDASLMSCYSMEIGSSFSKTIWTECLLSDRTLFETKYSFFEDLQATAPTATYENVFNSWKEKK